MTQYTYFLCDVFTDTPYAGNPLAVFPEADGLETNAMQRIAAELNLSETTFVFSGEPPRLRIFTPKDELPFAGHPTVGTAAVLLERGWQPAPGNAVLREEIGDVTLTVERGHGANVERIWLTAPHNPERGPELPGTHALAGLLGLPPEAVHTDWPSAAWSCGVPFACIALRDRESLTRATLDRAAWHHHLAGRWADKVYAFIPPDTDRTLAARMFAPSLGIEEDPATGAAACAVAGLLCERNGPGTHAWSIRQGGEMGRPSLLLLHCTVGPQGIDRVQLGGAAVIIGQGRLSPPTNA